MIMVFMVGGAVIQSNCLQLSIRTLPWWSSSYFSA
jgi:hypothetical protein